MLLKIAVIFCIAVIIAICVDSIAHASVTGAKNAVYREVRTHPSLFASDVRCTRITRRRYVCRLIVFNNDGSRYSTATARVTQYGKHYIVRLVY